MYDSNHSDALAGQKFASRAHLNGIESVEGLFEWLFHNGDLDMRRTVLHCNLLATCLGF